MALVVVAVAAIAIVASGNGGSESAGPGPGIPAPPPATTSPRLTPVPPAAEPPPKPPAGLPTIVRLTGIGAFDPDGDLTEHDEQAPQATDADPATFWATETYAGGLPKPGVGLVLDAESPISLSRMTLTTDTPGFTGEIKASRDSPTGPYTTISRSTTAAGTTRFSLQRRSARYYLLWITELDGVAHVNEIRGLKRADTAR